MNTAERKKFQRAVKDSATINNIAIEEQPLVMSICPSRNNAPSILGSLSSSSVCLWRWCTVHCTVTIIELLFSKKQSHFFIRKHQKSQTWQRKLGNIFSDQWGLTPRNALLCFVILLALACYWLLLGSWTLWHHLLKIISTWCMMILKLIIQKYIFSNIIVHMQFCFYKS